MTKNFVAGLQESAERFRADQRGSVLPIFAIMVILMIVIFGAAVDISRSVNAREKLSYAIDAASLSVAATLSTTVMTDDEIEQALKESITANLDGAEFIEAALDNLEFAVDSDAGTVAVSSSASLRSYFIDLGGYTRDHFGPQFLAFGANAQVSYSKFDVELALVVDVTGSMSGDMETLRKASKEVVDILLPADEEPEDAKVRISLVPYSQGVNLGLFANKVKGGNHYPVFGTCVTERQNYEDYSVQFTDAPFDYYEDSDPPPLPTFFGGGSSRCSSTSAMVPLTDNRDILIPAITALTATGATAGQTGVAWGWYSLSPNYQDVWPSGSVGASYDDDETLKFAIIMTDGDNNSYYDFVEQQERCSWTYRGGRWRYECQMVDVNQWLEYGESEDYDNISSTRQRALCAAMKDAGIEIFGVYFGSSDTSTGARNMKSCSSEGNYYKASSSSGLINAFANIARKIQQIYMSK